MPSPFPGMNPYLEHRHHWADFHDRLVVGLSNALIRQVRPNYIVKIEEFVYLHAIDDEDAERERVGRPDVGVMARRPTSPGGAVAVLEAPAAGGVPREVETELARVSYLEVRDREDRSLVTAVELLSPSNKVNGDDRTQHLLKCRRLLASPANVVEIDLLRGGERMPWRQVPDTDYLVTVSRAVERPRVGFWPVRLRERLPVIPVPLRAGQAEPTLDLQALLHEVYDDAGYEDHIYRVPPEPRLPPPDDTWAEGIARAATPA